MKKTIIILWVCLIFIVGMVLAFNVAIKPEYENYLNEKALEEGKTKEQITEKILEDVISEKMEREKINQLRELTDKCYTNLEMMDKCITALNGVLGNKAVGEQANSIEYKCSTNPIRTETCVCISGTRCYYETCGESPYGVCTSGEWELV